MKKRRDQIRRVGLLANPEKAACRAAVRQAVALITQAGRTAVADGPTARLAGLPQAARETAAELAPTVDLLVVFGGDGTILRMARETARSRTPLLGINVGNLGFLTAASVRQLARALEAVWDQRYQVETRSLIQARGGKGSRTFSALALNDFVLSRTTATRLIELEVLVDGRVLTRYRCDGLIVSSPTGSTAYSLAAGGAIVTPDAGVFALTPICPHTLSNRPVILNLRSVVQLRVLTSRVGVVLTADGQSQTPLRSGDLVTVRRSRLGVPLIWLEGVSFFETLRRKLRWSGSTV